MQNKWKGSCHCGAIRFVFESNLSELELPLRSCQCTFCKKHAPRYTSDPQGKLSLKVKAGTLSKYDSDHNTKRLICKKCGVYLGTTLTDKTKIYTVLNINTFESSNEFTQEIVMMDFSNEAPNERKKRQIEKWIPTTLSF